MPEVPHNVQSAPSGTIESVTPAVAQEWLDTYNVLNRKLKPRVVAMYARDMANGDWVFNGDTIRFDTDGNLLDGQHRLHAVVQSGVTVPMLVIWGLDPASRVVIDSGAKRSKGDALQLAGYQNTAALGSAVGILGAFDRGQITTAGSNPDFQPSHSETVALVEKYEREGELLDHVQAAVAETRDIRLSPTIIAVARYLQSRVASPEDVNEFWYGACYTAAPGDPRYTLRRWAQDQYGETRRGARRDISLRLFAVALCWNAWRSGKSISRIHYKVSNEVRDEEGRVTQPIVYRPIPKMK